MKISKKIRKARRARKHEKIQNRLYRKVYIRIYRNYIKIQRPKKLLNKNQNNQHFLGTPDHPISFELQININNHPTFFFFISSHSIRRKRRSLISQKRHKQNVFAFPQRKKLSSAWEAKGSTLLSKVKERKKEKYVCSFSLFHGNEE